MRAIGLRKLDSLGRIDLPTAVRRDLKMQKHDDIEIYVSSDGIVLRKHGPECIFCGESENVVTVHDKLVCKNCLNDLKSK